MLKLKQISFLDHSELIGTARYGIALNPSDIALQRNLRPEVSFDDLGYYEFLGLEVDKALVGFRKHIDRDKKYSYVSVLYSEHLDDLALISEICDVKVAEISTFDEPW